MNCSLYLYAEINASLKEWWPEKLKEETNKNCIVCPEAAFGYEAVMKGTYCP